MDGVDAETHQWISGVEGSFEASLEGIRNLGRAGLRPQIIMAIMKRNRSQMGPLVCLTESLGANSVKFNPIQPIGRGEKLYEAMETLTIQKKVCTAFSIRLLNIWPIDGNRRHIIARVLAKRGPAYRRLDFSKI